TIIGTVTITNSADVTALAPYRCIIGDLVINVSPSLATVSLPHLEQIGGNVLEHTPTSLDLPALISVDDGLLLIGPSIDLPALTTVGDDGLTVTQGVASL